MLLAISHLELAAQAETQGSVSDVLYDLTCDIEHVIGDIDILRNEAISQSV
jgi:hypothetical protein